MGAGPGAEGHRVGHRPGLLKGPGSGGLSSLAGKSEEESRKT